MPIASGPKLLQAAILLAYPVCSHFAVTLDAPQIQLLALVVLGLGLSFQGLLRNSGFSWLVMAGTMILALAVGYLGLSRWILYLPPVVLPALTWSVFYRSLSPGQIPLITRIAAAVRGELPAPLISYTRQITVLWSYLFASLSLLCAVLPFVASPQSWSLVTNLLCWVTIAAFFVGEFIYRQWRFQDLEHLGFLQYLQVVIRADVRKLG